MTITEININISYSNAGTYFLVSPDKQASISLGHCADEKELRSAVYSAIDAGSDDDQWDGWTVSYEA